MPKSGGGRGCKWKRITLSSMKCIALEGNTSFNRSSYTSLQTLQQRTLSHTRPSSTQSFIRSFIHSLGPISCRPIQIRSLNHIHLAPYLWFRESFDVGTQAQDTEAPNEDLASIVDYSAGGSPGSGLDHSSNAKRKMTRPIHLLSFSRRLQSIINTWTVMIF